MVKVNVLDKNISIADLEDMIRSGRVFTTPFSLNRSVYVINHKKPQNVMVTDISLKGIQLNGAWISWEQLEQEGGIYGSEFDAINAIAASEK
ncbi:MAG: hypothetical protein II169_05570 [Lachnospiraceae bacterium]|nr:hypothetical protein [Lachnospiraceae bacterium]